MFSPQSNSISEAISNRYIMASYVLGIIACLAFFIIRVSQAEVHLMVPSENVRDGKNQTFYCLFSDRNSTQVNKIFCLFFLLFFSCQDYICSIY